MGVEVVCCTLEGTGRGGSWMELVNESDDDDLLVFDSADVDRLGEDDMGDAGANFGDKTGELILMEDISDEIEGLSAADILGEVTLVGGMDLDDVILGESGSNGVTFLTGGAGASLGFSNRFLSLTVKLSLLNGEEGV